MIIKIILTCLLTLNIFLPSTQEDEVKNLNDHVINLESIGDEQKNSLQKYFNDRKIVGLGDATHGTNEFYSKKSELIKYLITNLHYKVVIYEAFLADTDEVNNYVMYGEGDIYKAIIGMGFTIWYTQEIYDLVEWIRIYNEDLPDEEKVRIYGCDMQAPQVAASKLKTFLEKNNVLTKDLSDGLDSMIKTRRKRSSDDKKIIKSTIKELDIAFEKLPSDEMNDQKLMLQYKRVLHQFEEYTLNNGGYSSSNLRNKFMAENVEFIYKFEGEKKTIIWTHNAHMAKKGGQDKIKPMGGHLSDTYGSDYYAVGFAFNKGSLLGYDRETYKPIDIQLGKADKNSVDFFFSKSVYPVFFLDFKSVSTDDLIASYIYKKTTSRNMGAGYYPGEFNRNYKKHVLSKSYSAVVFINETSPLVMLDWDRLK